LVCIDDLEEGGQATAFGAHVAYIRDVTSPGVDVLPHAVVSQKVVPGHLLLDHQYKPMSVTVVVAKSNVLVDKY
jgi:hypothetical protein